MGYAYEQHLARRLAETTARAEAAEAENAKLREALREIKELTRRRQLPLTHHINDTATAALGAEHGK